LGEGINFFFSSRVLNAFSGVTLDERSCKNAYVNPVNSKKTPLKNIKFCALGEEVVIRCWKTLHEVISPNSLKKGVQNLEKSALGEEVLLGTGKHYMM